MHFFFIWPNLCCFFFQAFALLLRTPHEDAQMIIRERFPVPRLVVCDQHGSQVSAFWPSFSVLNAIPLLLLLIFFQNAF